jgi:hypothetical protein
MVLAKNGENIFGLAIFLEDHAVLFAFSEEGDVGADGIILRERGPGSKNGQSKNAHQQRE